jgi:hypothetical protein
MPRPALAFAVVANEIHDGVRRRLGTSTAGGAWLFLKVSTYVLVIRAAGEAGISPLSCFS